MVKDPDPAPEDLPGPEPSSVSPDLVHREMGRSLDADDRRPGEAAARGEVGRLLLLGEGADKGIYHDAHTIEHMSHHLIVAHYSELGSGYGGYNQDHEFFGYRQSI